MKKSGKKPHLTRFTSTRLGRAPQLTLAAAKSVCVSAIQIEDPLGQLRLILAFVEEPVHLRRRQPELDLQRGGGWFRRPSDVEVGNGAAREHQPLEAVGGGGVEAGLDAAERRRVGGERRQLEEEIEGFGVELVVGLQWGGSEAQISEGLGFEQPVVRMLA